MPFLLGVGALAVLVVAYLVFDWLRSRRIERRVEYLRRAAREEWQRQLRDQQTKSDSASPKPDA